MKTSYLAVALTLTCILGLNISARADGDSVSVNVPFEFVAGGETLPAGTYSITRAAGDTNRILAIRGDNNRIFVLPMFFDGSSVTGTAAEHQALSFERAGNKYFLSTVKTLSGVYAFRTPAPMVKVGQMKEHNGLPSSGN